MNEREKQRIREAFKVARDQIFADTGEAPKPPKIVIRSLENALAIEKRLPDRENAFHGLARGSWQRSSAGRPIAAPHEVEQCEAVLHEFPRHRHGRTDERRKANWDIFRDLAAGVPMGLLRTHHNNVSPQTLRQRRDAQALVIAKKLKEFMPPH